MLVAVNLGQVLAARVRVDSGAAQNGPPLLAQERTAPAQVQSFGHQAKTGRTRHTGCLSIPTSLIGACGWRSYGDAI